MKHYTVATAAITTTTMVQFCLTCQFYRVSQGKANSPKVNFWELLQPDFDIYLGG